jgi:hypothetical protein
MVYKGLGVALATSLLLLLPRPASSSCPVPCTCRSSTVDCSNAQLDAIPKNLPRDTVKL